MALAKRRGAHVNPAAEVSHPRVETNSRVLEAEWECTMVTGQVP